VEPVGLVTMMPPRMLWTIEVSLEFDHARQFALADDDVIERDGGMLIRPPHDRRSAAVFDR
jgi:hypothetical protein